MEIGIQIRGVRISEGLLHYIGGDQPCVPLLPDHIMSQHLAGGGPQFGGGGTFPPPPPCYLHLSFLVVALVSYLSRLLCFLVYSVQLLRLGVLEELGHKYPQVPAAQSNLFSMWVWLEFVGVVIMRD